MVETVNSQGPLVSKVAPPKLRTLVAVAAVVAALVLLLFLPVVSYTASFADPQNVNPRLFNPCAIAVLNSTGRDEQPDFQNCYDISALPPSSVKGYASTSYFLTGWPAGPFPSLMLAKQGNSTYLLHFDGPRLSYIERALVGPNATLNPSGVLRIDNVTFSQWAFGMLNFSAHVTNIGPKTLWGLIVSFGYPAYGRNTSLAPVRVYSEQPVTSFTAILPGESLTASVLVNESAALLTDQSYPMTIEVSGFFTMGSIGSTFLYVDTVPVTYPGVGLNSHWVATFIQTLDQLRNGSLLAENKTLDEFAAFRFDTARSQYQISDYNFTYDYIRFFGSAKPAVLEEILYPLGKDPTTYPGYLKSTALEHYTDLLNSAYSKYGYFFGTGPAVEVGPGCTATEVPGPNINLEQWATSHGCTYVIADEVWFILILGG